MFTVGEFPLLHPGHSQVPGAGQPGRRSSAQPCPPGSGTEQHPGTDVIVRPLAHPAPRPCSRGLLCPSPGLSTIVAERGRPFPTLSPPFGYAAASAGFPVVKALSCYITTCPVSLACPASPANHLLSLSQWAVSTQFHRQTLLSPTTAADMGNSDLQSQ